MKTLKFLFVAAIVAFLSVSCEKELIEIMGLHDSTSVGENADSTLTQNPDTTNNQSPDTTIIADPTIISGTGEISTQVINLSDFTEIELKKIGEVEIIYGSEYKVEISDYTDLLPFAIVYLEGERLVLSYDDSKQVMGSKLKMSITIPNKLTKVIVSGAGNINIQSGLSTENVQLIIPGAGNISAANINSRSVNIEMPGSGVIEAQGTTGDLTLKVKGSGTIKCQALISANAFCDISGVTTVFLSATDKLKVDALSIGSLTYNGNPVLDINTGVLFSVIKGENGN